LTRYLYPKHNVEYSLKVSLLQENLTESLFWAYELYHSGYKIQVLQLLLNIFDNYFENTLQKNKMYKFLQKKMEEWQQTQIDSTVATFIVNIIHCKKNMDHTQLFVEEFAERCKSIYIVYKDADIQSYKNRPFVLMKSWKIPAKMCLFHCLREPGSPELNIQEYDNWVFYASYSPLWKSRIQKYYGIVDLDEKCVRFSDEDSEENFYNLYNLEPDEQPLAVQDKWFGNVH
jgi:hypothetical protein